MTGDDPIDQGEIPEAYTLGQHIGFAVCALVAFAAVTATWYAIGVDVVANENVGTLAYQRSFLNSTQVIVAIAGLVPIGIGSLCVAKRQWRTAAIALAITLVTYLLWGVLNDAAVHGWGQLKVFLAQALLLSTCAGSAWPCPGPGPGEPSSSAGQRLSTGLWPEQSDAA